MARDSTRRRILLQATEAYADLERAQIHMVQMSALAKGQSPPINADLDLIVTANQMVIDALVKLKAEL